MASKRTLRRKAETWRWRFGLCTKCRAPLGAPGVTAHKVFTELGFFYACQACALPTEFPIVRACRRVWAKIHAAKVAARVRALLGKGAE